MPRAGEPLVPSLYSQYQRLGGHEDLNTILRPI